MRMARSPTLTLPLIPTLPLPLPLTVTLTLTGEESNTATYNITILSG